MKTLWLKKDDAEDLVLFFNGWGMDCRIASYLMEESEGGFSGDFMVCYDYRSLLPEPGFALLTEGYRNITVVAWSLGVWAARQAGLEKVRKAIAINGTTNPVSDTEGIPPVLFHATRTTWTDESRLRFNRRMCGSEEVLDFFASMSPVRETEEQHEEIVCIGDELLNIGPGPGSSWKYNQAIIGGRDLIFPALQQFNAWKGVPQTIISDMPHFPFFHFRTLQEVLACME